MTEKRFNIEFDGHQYFLVIDEDNERCLARLDTRMDAFAWLEMYKMLSEKNEQLKEIIYEDESQIIGEWSSHIQKDMAKLNKAYESDDINDLIRFCKED